MTPSGSAFAHDSNSESAQPRKILIVRLSSLGDVIQTLPLPSVIRRTFPQAKIGWAIDSELAAAITDHPQIDRIHRCDRLRWGREFFNPFNWPKLAAEIERFVAEIRNEDYDVAIDAQGLLKSALIPYFAGISRRLGFRHWRELTTIFYTEKYISRREYFDPSRHHLEHMLRLVSALGCDTTDYSIHLQIGADASRNVDSLLASLPRASTLVGIVPGTQWKSKIWPIEYWERLIHLILDESGANVVLIGAASDAALAARLRGRFNGDSEQRVLNLAGRTSLQDLFALLARVSVTVASDTAPLHIAAAVGTHPVIGVFGPTSPQRTGPLGAGERCNLTAAPNLRCQPCRERACRFGTTECMRSVLPEKVFFELCSAVARQNLIDANGEATGSH